MTHAKPALDLGGSVAVFAFLNLVKVLQMKSSNIATLRVLALGAQETRVASLLAGNICKWDVHMLFNYVDPFGQHGKIGVPANPTLEVGGIRF